MAVNACVICRLPSERRCSACEKVTYCSTEHQKEDWKVHKLSCLLYKVSKNEKVGRYLTATRNIVEGTIIFVEKPIVLGPKIYSLPICLSCYKRVDSSYFCTHCGFPMCSNECANADIHRENECKIFAKKSSSSKKIENYEIPHPLYQSILPLRCLLLRDTFPEKWQALNTLEHHLESRRFLSDVWNEFQVNIVQFLRNWHGLQEIFSEETVNRVIGFIEVNSFQIKTVKKIELCGLFRLGGLLSHDCRPNTHHAFTPEGHLILRASVTIKKGSAITISYVDTLSGTEERRQILAQSKYFQCDCSRCADPTEFGTFISGLKCKSCSDGYLLPQNPLSPLSPWVCFYQSTGQLNSTCDNFMSLAQISSQLEQIKETLKLLHSSSSETELESQITQQTQILHPNHFLLLPFWKHLLSLKKINQESRLGKSCIEDLYRNKRLVEKLLSVLDALDPGLSRGRGVLLRQLEGTLVQLVNLERNHLEKDYSSTAVKFMDTNLHQLRIEIDKIFELDYLIRDKPQNES